jgi:cell division protein FtsW (lipid II flippase)
MTRKRTAQYALAVIGIIAATALLEPFRDDLNSTTVALALLLVVLFVATLWGSAARRCSPPSSG